MTRTVSQLPNEAVFFIQVMHDVADATGVPDLPLHTFFLRFVSPALSQPNEVCGLNVTDAVRAKMLDMSKALQSIVNGVEPSPESLAFAIREKLPKLRVKCKAMLQTARELSKRPLSPSLIVPDLLDPAIHMGDFLASLRQVPAGAASTAHQSYLASRDK